MVKNIFENTNTSVVKAPTISGAPPTGGATYFGQKKMQEIEAAERNEVIKKTMDAVMKDRKISELNGYVVDRRVTDARITNAINAVTKDGKEILFTNILEDIFKKSLLLDDEFVTQKEGAIHGIVSSYVKANGGFGILERAIAHTDSNVLREMRSICEETAKKVTNRKLKEKFDANDPSSISFEMTPEEDEEFEFDKGKISPDDIADLVKKKVFTVIKDEKARQEDSDKLIGDIEDELKNSDDVTDEKTAKEALNRILVGVKPVEETTLFNAIFRNAYHEYLTENLAGSQYTVQNNEEKRDDSNIIGDWDVNDAINMGGELDPDNPDTPRATPPKDVDTEIKYGKEVNMDLVLSEAIATYTLMETLYTLKLENYTYQDFRVLTNKLIHPESGLTTGATTFGCDGLPVGVRDSEIVRIVDRINRCPSEESEGYVSDILDSLVSYVNGLSDEDKKGTLKLEVTAGLAKLNNHLFRCPDDFDKFKPVLDWLKMSL